MVEALERVDRLGRRLVDVDQPLVRTDLEVLAGVLVLERRADHAVHVLLRGQRHGTRDGRAGARRRLDDLLGRCLDRRVVIRLQANADFVLGDGCHDVSLSFLRVRAGPGYWAAQKRSYLLLLGGSYCCPPGSWPPGPTPNAIGPCPIAQLR